MSGASGYNSAGNDATGGGGSAIISAASGLDGVTVKANGGTGGSNSGIKVGFTTGSPHGPGGGGGVVFASGALNGASSVAGGANGTTNGNIAYGAEPGTVSSLLMQNQFIPGPISCIVLSLNFLSVAATSKNENISISWKVANETEVQEYIVERSADGLTFTQAGTQPRRSNNSGINDYLFSDVRPLTGSYAYYRVRALPVQGASTYSAIARVKLSPLAESAFISPNPVHASTSFNLVSAANGNVEIKLIDTWGRTCWRQLFPVSAGANVLPVEGLEKLHNGVYWLQYNNGSRPEKIKLLIQH